MRAIPFAFAVLLTIPAAPALQTPPLTPDIPPTLTAPVEGYDYVKRVEMVPIRDGFPLYTVIVIPAGARIAPILLTRTPYNAAARAKRNASPGIVATLQLS